jgi:hypothetical protein
LSRTLVPAGTMTVFFAGVDCVEGAGWEEGV